MNNNTSTGFNYTYSAKEQEEIKKIRQKYSAEKKNEERDLITRIRELDSSVTDFATAASICVGIIGALIMGFGMSLIMTDLRNYLSMSSSAAMIVGIIIGVIGMISVITAYPLYHFIVEKRRKKVAPEILRLTEELLEEGK